MDGSREISPVQPSVDRQDHGAAASIAGKQNENRSWLGEGIHKLVGTVWHNDSQARKEVELVAGEFVKDAALFTGKKAGLLGTAVLYGLDSMQVEHKGLDLATDALLGAGKGVSTKAVFSLVGNLEAAPSIKGMVMGSTSRLVDQVFTPGNFYNNQHFDATGGALNALKTAYSLPALAVDAATFGLAHGALKVGNLATAGKLGESAVATTMFSGATFGLTSGAMAETQRQYSSNNSLDPRKYDFGKILAASGKEMAITGLASLAGHKLTVAIDHSKANVEVNTAGDATASGVTVKTPSAANDNCPRAANDNAPLHNSAQDMKVAVGGDYLDLPPINARFVHQSSDAPRNLTVVEGGKLATMAIGANQGTTDRLHSGNTSTGNELTGSRLTDSGVTFDSWLKLRETEPSVLELPESTRTKIGTIWSDLTEEQRALPLNDLSNIAKSWSKLEPAQKWQELSARDAADYARSVLELALDYTGALTLYRKPALRAWLTENSEATVNIRCSMINHDFWDNIPESYKQLSGDDMEIVHAAWYQLSSSDWENVSVNDATDVAKTILFMGPYLKEEIIKNPEFAKWCAENQMALRSFRSRALEPVLNFWTKLLPEDKSMLPAELVKRATILKYQDMLEDKLGASSSAVARYLGSLPTADGSIIQTVAKWIDNLKKDNERDEPAFSTPGIPDASKTGKELLSHLVGEGAPLEAFSMQALNNRFYMDHYFGDIPALKDSLVKLLASEDQISKLWQFVHADPVRNKVFVQTAEEAGLIGSLTDWTLLYRASEVAILINLDEQSQIKHLLFLGDHGLHLEEMAKYLNENSFLPSNQALMKELLAQQADASQFALRRFFERGSLSLLDNRTFTEPERSRLAELQGQGLSIVQLINHLADDPGKAQSVKELLAAGADSRQLDTFMRLSVFPDDVAIKILNAAKEGKIRSEAVIGKMRDLVTGRSFTDLLNTHLSNGGPLSQEQLDLLSAQSAKNAQSLKPASQNRIASSSILDSAPEAKAFTIAAESILKTVPGDKPIVLLGRDTWPLVPLLRAQGREVQYFMWSRLQKNDEPTKQQWLKEVPPDAVVIDTGFHGSIINQIKEIDPNVTGFLMASHNKKVYPQLLGSDFDDAVGQIEKLPKLIYRSSSHTENGGAVSRRDTNNSDTDTTLHWGSNSRWVVEQKSRALLRATGLPEWDVWRYSQFVGLTPLERLGLSTKEQVNEHYQKVGNLRSANPPT
jgi:hypothetical protein